ncbi:hypothetical protein JKF63_01186 [Porcisia hertigi]|uniref:Uncharacterized protein n=1 Tax=Porcisia hertigi TaxID=2761500 RepID=A0A836L0E4_9TRYP|nr:hypothetical protein JKF63_01186 [Porcisia hertigi]
MAECTVYSPCGRYVIRFSSDAAQPLLRLTVTENSKRPIKGESVAADDSNSCKTLATPSAATAPLTSSSALHPLRLVASLTETDVLALTTSAGVRKSFSNFSQMLYDALIGRSPCVHFFVETVAEMKERIQQDVQRQVTSTKIAPGAEARPPCGKHAGDLQVSLSALDPLTVSGANMRTNTGKGRVCTAVGDTVIELDEDVASEVLEQRFFTLDYDVDFTRAIFPIPLLSGVADGASAEAASVATCAWKDTTDTSPATLTEATSEPFVGRSSLSTAAPIPASEAELLRNELLLARDRLSRLGSENARLRRENEALVRLSRQKMHEMQRLCGDFQHQVQLAADAERLRAKNTELRAQLQEALENQQKTQRSLDRARSQGRRLYSADTANGCGGRAPRAASGHRSSENPYLRSLSRESRDGAGASSSRFLHGRQRSECSATFRAGATRRGRSLMSPAPAPAVLRGSRAQRASSLSSTSGHRSTRFDTPPPPPSSDPAAPFAAVSLRHRSGSRSAAREGDGDSPAPHGRTGGRLDRARKPSRRCSSGSAPNGSRASSTHSLPRRGRSLWADGSSYPSPFGSVTSSRSSSANHERLYRTATASSRMHQTPKMHTLDSATAPRRCVFH